MVMTSQLSCPTRFDFQELLGGNLPGEVSTTLLVHLESCASCGDTVQELLAVDRIDRLAVSPRSTVDHFALPVDLMDHLLALQPTISIPRDAELRSQIDLPEAIEDYEVLGVLGRGGMGVVYKARQKALNRHVALKMLLSGGHSGPGEIERFRAEAEAVAKLQHPNIVQIHNVGSAGGRPYFSMELVDGGSLAQKLQGQPLQPIEAARLAKTLAVAIQVAHEHGILHRDLKPANILLHIANGESVPKIGDFGLAKHVDDDSGQTATGSILGTPSYMSPEQASGRNRDVGPRSDVYSLGAILYETLTGRPPFRGGTTVETLDMVRTREPIAPRSLQPGVPFDLETICLKCLHKDTTRRYDSARALSTDLERFLAGLPIKARPVGTFERCWKWAKRYPAVAALFAVLLVATPLLIGLWIQARSATNDLAKANEDIGQQRNATRKREAELTFDKGLELCNSGQIGDGLLWMAHSLEVDPMMSPVFERVVRINIAEWSQHKIQLVRQLPHPSIVWGVAMSPKGDVFATGCFDGIVRLWDCQSFELKTELKEAIGCELRDLDFSPDGTKLAVALGFTRRTADGAEPAFGAMLWDLTANPPATVLLDAADTMLTVRFSRDGKTVATGGGVDKDRTVRLWDATARTARLLGEVTIPKRHENAFTFSPDDKAIFIASHAGEVYRWNLGEAEVKTLPWMHSAKNGIRWVEVSPDGKTVATSGDDFAVRFWDLKTGEPKSSPLLHRQTLHSQRYMPDGRGIVACSGVGGVTLWDAVRGTKVEQLDQGAAGRLGIHPEGDFFVTGSLGRTVQVWRVPRAESVVRPRVDQHNVNVQGGVGANVSAISADGQKIASRESSSGMALRVWNAAGEPISPKLDFPVHVIADMAFSPDGRFLAVGGWRNDGTVRGYLAVWDTLFNPPTCRVFVHSNYVKTLAFHPNGRILAAGDYHQFIRFWDLETNREAFDPIRETDIVMKLAYDRDGKTLVVGTARDWSGKPHLQFWDAVTRERIGDPIAHAATITNLGFSPDFKAIFTSGTGNTVQLWDTGTRQILGKPIPMSDELEALAFSVDGTTLALGSSNGMVKTYRSATGELQPGRFDHPHRPQSLAFHPEGKQLMVGCGDGTVWLWDLDTRRQLGPPVVHSRDIVRVAFLDGGDRFLTVAGDGSVRRWRSPTPTTLDLPTLKHRIEIMTSKSMTNDGTILPFLPEAWEQRRQDLIQYQGSDRMTLVKPLSISEWHDARARDARQDGDSFAERWHLQRRSLQPAK